MRRNPGRGIVACGIVGVALAAWLACAIPQSPPAAPAAHAVLIGIDGLTPAGLRAGDQGTFGRLMKEGAFSLTARAVFPTVSSPNWASMIMAAEPERHGITSNDWEPDTHDVPTAFKGPGGIFPTLISQLRTARPNAVIAVFHDWDGYGRLIEKPFVDVIQDLDGPDQATARAEEYLKAKAPTLTIVHLDHVDAAGHEYGWMSEQYVAAVRHADALVARLISAIETQPALRGTTAVLVTSDHGGEGKKHGGVTSVHLEIPWLLWGAGVRSGLEIQDPISTVDSAATLAYLLGVPLHRWWTGRPVMAAIRQVRS
jgi:predicted AlkP superfamily pyrophosphatase or phosphodiesterase